MVPGSRPDVQEGRPSFDLPHRTRISRLWSISATFSPRWFSGSRRIVTYLLPLRSYFSSTRATLVITSPARTGNSHLPSTLAKGVAREVITSKPLSSAMPPRFLGARLKIWVANAVISPAGPDPVWYLGSVFRTESAYFAMDSGVTSFVWGLEAWPGSTWSYSQITLCWTAIAHLLRLLKRIRALPMERPITYHYAFLQPPWRAMLPHARLVHGPAGDRLIQVHVPVPYLEVEPAARIAAYPGFVVYGCTLSSEIGQRQQGPGLTLLTCWKSPIFHWYLLCVQSH